MKTIISIIILGLVVIGVLMVSGGEKTMVSNIGDDTDVSSPVVEPEVPKVSGATDYKNTTYTIDGQMVQLVDGYAETESGLGSVAKVVTRYFGNELVTDLDGDGDDDVAFILTQDSGGSGTFYYAVAALQTPEGYVGSDGYLLGDRIAPQSTNLSQNPRQVRVVVFNYADRAIGEPMTTSPSVGKGAYLKIVPETNTWAVVEPDFEG